jgi:protein TonB
MQANQILQTNTLDLIFENRNKSYGAYDHRKNYEKRLTKSLLISILTGVVMIGFFVNHGQNKKAETPRRFKTVLYSLPPTVSASKKSEAKTPSQSKQTKNKKPMIQSGKPVIKDEVPFVFNKPDSFSIGNVNADLGTKGNGTGKTGTPGDSTNTDGGQGKPGTNRPDIHTTFQTAEVMPSFPGGMQALRRFLENNLGNPEQLEEGEEIEVKVSFVVGYDGKLKGFQVIKDGGPAFNDEVIRVLKKMPDWIPGKSKGEHVSVYYSIPVKFTAVIQ